jgi:hypothetical protein
MASASPIHIFIASSARRGRMAAVRGNRPTNLGGELRGPSWMCRLANPPALPSPIYRRRHGGYTWASTPAVSSQSDGAPLHEHPPRRHHSHTTASLGRRRLRVDLSWWTAGGAGARLLVVAVIELATSHWLRAATVSTPVAQLQLAGIVSISVLNSPNIFSVPMCDAPGF